MLNAPDCDDSFVMYLHSQQQGEDGAFDFTLPREYTFEDKQFRVLLDTLIKPSNIDNLDGCELLITRLLDKVQLKIPVQDERINTDAKLKNHLNQLAKEEDVLAFLNATDPYLKFTKYELDSNIKVKAESLLQPYTLSFSPEMCHVLSIAEDTLIYPGDELICQNVNLGANVQSFMVKTDLVEQSVFNDTHERIIALHATKRERRKVQTEAVLYDYSAARTEEYHSSVTLPVAAGRVLNSMFHSAI